MKSIGTGPERQCQDVGCSWGQSAWQPYSQLWVQTLRTRQKLCLADPEISKSTPCLAKTKTVPAAIWSRDAVTNEDSVFNFPVPADAGGVRVPPDKVRACQSLQSDELGAVVWDAAVFLAWYLCQHLGCQVAATFLESKAQSDTAQTHFLLPGTIGSARMLASWMSLSVCCCFRRKPQDRTPERACKAMYMLRRLPSTNDT